MPDFVTVADTTEIPPGATKAVELDGEAVVIANVDGRYFAVEGTCSHRGGPLGEGTLTGDILHCPWHRGGFNVRTGEAVALPTTDPILTYRVRVTGTAIQIAPA
jgi:nitrite reductase/ring-hydroxylating ferredoxin subunit